jgi:hypothetical protein
MDRLHNCITTADIAVAVLTIVCAVGAVYCVLAELGCW